MAAQATITEQRIENLVIATSRIMLKRAYYDLFTGIRQKKPGVVNDCSAENAELGKIFALTYLP
jgi:hypothetical protein